MPTSLGLLLSPTRESSYDRTWTPSGLIRQPVIVPHRPGADKAMSMAVSSPFLEIHHPPTRPG
jgi:hypothetical protein